MYVETNFLLELGLRQAHSDAAERILELAEGSQIELAFPELALLEAIYTVQGMQGRQARLARRLEKEIAQVRRSKPSPEDLAALTAPIGVLTTLGETRRDELQVAARRMLASARLIPSSIQSLGIAREAQTDLGLSMADSFIFGVIYSDINSHAAGPRCVLSLDQSFCRGVGLKLKGVGCPVFSDFKKGLAYIKTGSPG